MKFNIKTDKPEEIEKKLSEYQERYKNGFKLSGFSGFMARRAHLPPISIVFDYEKTGPKTFVATIKFLNENMVYNILRKALIKELKQIDPGVSVVRID